MLLTFLTAVVIAQVPAPTQVPASQAVPPAQTAPAPQPKAVRTEAPAAAPAPQVRPQAKPKTPTRIDQRKPFMRVWYWPPSPAGAGVPPQDQEAGSGAPVVDSDDRIDSLDDVNFPTNRSRLVDEPKQLAHLAAWMNANPAISVKLEGHADKRGASTKNKKLGLSRAQAVKDYLIHAGITENRIAVESFGSSQPLKGETLDEGYWLSRRVAIRFSSNVAAAEAQCPDHAHEAKPAGPKNAGKTPVSAPKPHVASKSAPVVPPAQAPVQPKSAPSPAPNQADGRK